VQGWWHDGCCVSDRMSAGLVCCCMNNQKTSDASRNRRGMDKTGNEGPSKGYEGAWEQEQRRKTDRIMAVSRWSVQMCEPAKFTRSTRGCEGLYSWTETMGSCCLDEEPSVEKFKIRRSYLFLTETVKRVGCDGRGGCWVLRRPPNLCKSLTSFLFLRSRRLFTLSHARAPTPCACLVSPDIYYNQARSRCWHTRTRPARQPPRTDRPAWQSPQHNTARLRHRALTLSANGHPMHLHRLPLHRTMKTASMVASCQYATCTRIQQRSSSSMHTQDGSFRALDRISCCRPSARASLVKSNWVCIRNTARRLPSSSSAEGLSTTLSACQRSSARSTSSRCVQYQVVGHSGDDC